MSAPEFQSLRLQTPEVSIQYESIFNDECVKHRMTNHIALVVVRSLVVLWEGGGLCNELLQTKRKKKRTNRCQSRILRVILDVCSGDSACSEHVDLNGRRVESRLAACETNLIIWQVPGAQQHT